MTLREVFFIPQGWDGNFAVNMEKAPFYQQNRELCFVKLLNQMGM